MTGFLFYFFSALVLGSALLVVLNRNPVNAAIYLLVSMAGTAALFFLLEAFFLGVLQILVYAGAVVVLFLFIIMLIDPESSPRIPWGRPNILTAFVSFGLLVAGVSAIFRSDLPLAAGTLESTQPVGNLSKEYGYYLFSVYLLPFLVAGFLLLIAMVGVILISKRFPRENQA